MIIVVKVIMTCLLGFAFLLLCNLTYWNITDYKGYLKNWKSRSLCDKLDCIAILVLNLMLLVASILSFFLIWML